MVKKDLLNSKKIAKATRIICIIFVFAALAGVVVFGGIPMIGLRSTSFDNYKPMIDSGKLDLLLILNNTPAAVFTSSEDLSTYMAVFLTRISACAAVFIVVAIFLMGLLKSVEACEPFAASNVKRLRAIAVTLIAGSVVIPVASNLVAAMNSVVADMQSYSLVDATLLLCGLLVLVISGVFAYGARLQREHDQTV